MTRKRKGADLPDYARCNGVGDDVEGWREGCEDCLRRTSQPSNPERVLMIEPPRFIAFFCENYIGEEFERKRQPQDGFTLIEALIVAALLAALALVLIGGNVNRDRFERACDKSGGETVWDGRQYQCLKRQSKE